MIKIIGIIFIVFSCSGLGYVLGSKFNMRVRELRFLTISLQMLETEIVYSNTPLPEAFSNVQKRSSSPVKELFEEIKNNLNRRTFSSVGEAFAKATDDIKGKLCLVRDDIEILKSFGYSIGNSDVDGQIKSFKMVIKQIEGQEVKAEEIRGKNERMYKNLGFLSGLAIAILLL